MIFILLTCQTCLDAFGVISKSWVTVSLTFFSPLMPTKSILFFSITFYFFWWLCGFLWQGFNCWIRNKRILFYLEEWSAVILFCRKQAQRHILKVISSQNIKTFVQEFPKKSEYKDKEMIFSTFFIFFFTNSKIFACVI